MTTKDRSALVDALLDLAMAEDIGDGDVTTQCLVPEAVRTSGHFVSRESGVLAGMEIVERLFARIDSGVSVTRIAQEGEHIRRDQQLAEINGPARSILTGERLALNLLQRMSGVASLTRRYVDAVNGTKAKIYDTRKTIPGLRVLDKLAVYIGGGNNHRQGLFDMVLIKDNHIRLAGPSCPQGSVACAINLAREKANLKIMAEVDTLAQLKEALEAEPDMILLDNMDPDTLAEGVRLTNQLTVDHELRRPILEASGCVTLKTVREIASSGVDRISVGAITHSATALDIGLDLA